MMGLNGGITEENTHTLLVHHELECSKNACALP